MVVYAPAQIISAPAQLTTAPAQPPATGAVVYTALFLVFSCVLFFCILARTYEVSLNFDLARSWQLPFLTQVTNEEDGGLVSLLSSRAIDQQDERVADGSTEKKDDEKRDLHPFQFSVVYHWVRS